jgi:hypothetical protein
MRILLVLLSLACGSGMENPAKQAIGSACTADADCSSGTCLTPASYPQYTGGYCSQLQCGTCPTGSFCTTGAATRAAACLKICTTAADCRTGYSCCTEASMGMKVCVPSTGTSLQC